jgi:hypothetical protein
MGTIHWSIAKINNQTLDNPKINMLYPLRASYRGHKSGTYGKRIWDKLKSYWVHVDMLGTNWEQIGNNKIPTPLKETRGVSHCGLAMYTKKYLKAKEELWKYKYFTMQQYNLQNIL